MIKSTFNFIPGIGYKTEKIFWNEGVFTWDDLYLKLNTLHISETKQVAIEDYIRKAQKALSLFDSSFFANYLPSKDHWRLYKEFSSKTLFLDIETTGLSHYYDVITMIGTFDGNKLRYFVKDNNLDQFPDHLKKYKLIVTFNGKLFDIPFIRKLYPNINIPEIHIDLRYLLRSVGIDGPLKKIETRMGISRPPEISNLNGREAVVLWNRFLNGNNEDLEKLLLYNSYDTVNLQSLLKYCYDTKANEIYAQMKDATYQVELGKDPQQLNNDFTIESQNIDMPKILTKEVDNGYLEVYSNKQKVLGINRSAIQKTEIKLSAIIRRIKNKGFQPLSLGIDLTGSEKRPSGVCVLNGNEAELELLKTDQELISKAQEVKPTIISIDSPLSLPNGRCCEKDSCECRQYGITRECERILKRRGINVYPCLIQSMQQLTLRGMRLANILREQGFKVIESYPGGTGYTW